MPPIATSALPPETRSARPDRTVIVTAFWVTRAFAWCFARGAALAEAAVRRRDRAATSAPTRRELMRATTHRTGGSCGQSSFRSARPGGGRLGGRAVGLV